MDERAPHAYAAGLRGELEPALDYLASAGASTEAEAWRAALRALVWHADPDRGALPDLAATRDLAGASAEARHAAALACVHAERAAWLAFDVAGHASWLALHAELTDAADDPRWLVAACLADTLAERAEGRDEDAARAETAATRAGLAETAVDAAAARATFALARGDVAEATRIARRAFRMARTEELPQQQYLAGLVLARVRREAESLHLAVRILSALARAAPSTWLGAVRWELFLCAGAAELGAHPGSGAHAVDPVIDAASSALRAAERGEHGEFVHHLGIAEALAPAGAVRRQIVALRDLADPSAPVESVCEDAADWARGLVDRSPFGLVGVRTEAASPDEPLDACVAASPGSTPRRVLGVGVGLAGPLLESARPGRLETAIAALALAGGRGIDKAALWETAYGFAFEPPVHGAALEALLHRLRELLGDAATVDRRGATLVLEVNEPFAVPDPRCTRSLDDELLRVLARAGTGSAKDAASSLGVPLRTVQLRLRRLAEEGSCTIERHGRSIEYRVEDTTFVEPTRKVRA